MNTKKLKTAFLILGILALIFAALIVIKDAGYNESNQAYGGDAYTGIQQAAAQTANNVVDLAEIVQTGIVYILLIHGGVLISLSICFETPKEDDRKSQTQQNADLPAL